MYKYQLVDFCLPFVKSNYEPVKTTYVSKWDNLFWIGTLGMDC